MPNESCRTCGGELVRYSLCSHCRKVIRRICRMCALKTDEEIHPNCIYIDAYQTTMERNVSEFLRDNSRSTIRIRPHRKHQLKNGLNIIFVISGIVGIFIGLAILNSFTLLPNSTNQEQVVNPTPVIKPESMTPEPIHEARTTYVNQPTTILSDSNKPKYSNCLGSSNGQYMTILCPTAYGYVYKALVEIPSNLVSEFENKVFSLRGFSVIEDVNSILIEYGEKIYLANFVTR